jgi:hypothetical protein
MYDLGHIGWPQPFEKLHVFLQNEIETTNLDLNIIAHHITYNRDTVRSVMPLGRRLFAILRHPFAQLRSSLNFFRVASKLGLTDYDAMSEFLRNPNELEPKTRFVFNGKDYGDKSVTRNFMSTYFGLSDENLKNKTAIATFIKEIHQDFHLILIKEHMYESLVLLRRILCWDLADLIFIFPKSEHYHFEFNDDIPLRQIHEIWSPVDYALYAHFNKTLWERISKEGANFNTEVGHFKNMNERVNTLCRDGQTESFLHFNQSRWNKEFRVKRHHCEDLRRMPEQWTPILKSRLRRKVKFLLQNSSRSIL